MRVEAFLSVLAVRRTVAVTEERERHKMRERGSLARHLFALTLYPPFCLYKTQEDIKNEKTITGSKGSIGPAFAQVQAAVRVRVSFTHPTQTHTSRDATRA